MLVVERERDGVEHVEPEAFLPAAVLGEIDPQRREVMRDGQCHFRLLGLTVAGDALPHPLRGVHDRLRPCARGEIASGARQLVERIEPRDRVAVRLLDDDDIDAVSSQPPSDVVTGDIEPVGFRDEPKIQHAAREQASAAKDGVAEFPQPGIDGEDGLRSLVHTS